MKREVNLLEFYPQSKRPIDDRGNLITEQDRATARKFDIEYFDGDRLTGYGGYNYSPRFWTETVAHIKDFYNLGKVYKPKLKSGELLIFNPEILHATHLNTGDSTRVVFSGRIEINKPKFYNKGFQIKEPYWIKSNDVMNKNYNNLYLYYHLLLYY